MAVQNWINDCEARGMAGSAWSFEETRALLNLWEDDRVQRQLEGCWKLFSTVGLCPHTQQVSSDGRAVDRDDIPPHSSHQRSVHTFDSASSVPYTVRRKMFAINNFREFREWSTFANIIIRELLCSQIHGIYI